MRKGWRLLDSSLTTAWCFGDETSPETDEILAWLTGDARAYVPTLGHLEIANVLWACEWRKRVERAPKAAAARDVYCGRSFQEAVLAARTGRADFRIISGGLALVRADETIPTYGVSRKQNIRSCSS